MSTPIWNEGPVAASLCTTLCTRCDARGQCVQLCYHFDGFVAPATMNLCLDCWTELVLRVSEIIIDKLAR